MYVYICIYIYTYIHTYIYILLHEVCSFGHVRDVYPLLALARTHLQQQRPHQLYHLFFF
jgi:hypothetical protein